MKKTLTVIFAILIFPALCLADVDLDGTDDHLIKADNASLSALSPLTIVAFIERTGLTATTQTIATKWDNGGTQREWTFELSDTGVDLLLGIYDETEDALVGRIDSGNTITSNTPFCVAGVWDGGDTDASVKLYIDDLSDSTPAAQVDDANIGAGAGFVAIRDTTAPVVIGARENSGTPNRHFVGVEGEINIIEAELSLKEVQNMCSSGMRRMGLQVEAANNKGNWPLDDLPEGGNLASASFIDMGGNGNTMTGVDVDTSGGQGKAGKVLSYPFLAINYVMIPPPAVEVPGIGGTIFNSPLWGGGGMFK